MSNMWDERYSDKTFFYGENPNDFLKDVANNLTPHSKILCLAEGEGRNAVFLASLGHQVTAVDMSVVGLEKLQTLAQHKSVSIKTIVANLENYQIEENNWDAIISIWCHLPSELRKKVHLQCVKGLKSSGVFILEAYTPMQLEFKTGGPSSLDMLMAKSDLEVELDGLNFKIIQEIKRDVQEGQGHKGESAVIQILGIRNNFTKI